jgi:hypothetical protein
MEDPKRQFQYAMDFLGVRVLRDDYQEWRSCSRKSRYKSRARAERAVQVMMVRGETGLHAYKCDFCPGYHIGHPSRFKNEQRKEVPPMPNGAGNPRH